MKCKNCEGEKVVKNGKVGAVSGINAKNAG